MENRKKLQVLQNKGLRCTLVKQNDSNRDVLHQSVHKEAKIVRLKHRRNIHLLSYMYDVSYTEKHMLKCRKEGVREHNIKKCSKLGSQ